MNENKDIRAVQEVNIIEVLKNIGRKNKRLQAKILQELEGHINKNSHEYEDLRKFILDEVNSYTRSVMREIFGDIEFMIKS